MLTLLSTLPVEIQWCATNETGSNSCLLLCVALLTGARQQSPVVSSVNNVRRNEGIKLIFPLKAQFGLLLAFSNDVSKIVFCLTSGTNRIKHYFSHDAYFKAFVSITKSILMLTLTFESFRS